LIISLVIGNSWGRLRQKLFLWNYNLLKTKPEACPSAILNGSLAAE